MFLMISIGFVRILGIFGGYLLGVRTSTGLSFYDWETLDLVRRIEVQPKYVLLPSVDFTIYVLITTINALFTVFRNIFWNETGDLVCLATDDCYFVLQVDTGAIQAAIDAKQGLGEDGLESAFDVSNLCIVFVCLFC